VQGAGENMQGVFMNDSVKRLPFRKFVISDNLFVGGSYNAIGIEHLKASTISDNLIIGLDSQQETPSIHLQNSDGVTLSNNTAPKYWIQTSTNITETGDRTNADATDMGYAALSSWLASHDHPMVVGLKTAEQLISDLPNVAQTLDGTGGSNVQLTGGGGSDFLVGGDGADTLNGFNGNDVMIGGAGADTFVFRPGSGQDTIEDFRAGDMLDVSAFILDGQLPILTDDPGHDDMFVSFAGGDSIRLLGVHPLDVVTAPLGLLHL
jgi:Ca2+-binding RTX toxin-like protein